ncbi:MAG: endonuclease III [Planctomycetota bacterium]|nr:endonuclease III [Planctomycetota bacterium]
MARPARPPTGKQVEHARNVAAALARAYPDATCTLDYTNPLELLVATILSAQCTDVRVNMVTPALFAKYTTAAEYAASPPGELEAVIQSTGFYRNKSRSIRAACKDIAEKHGGKVPDNLDDLCALRGVGRKTANVVLGNAFGKPGIVVDTHVGRVARRLGLTKHADPVKAEFELMKLFPADRWTVLSHQMILHGRQVCKAPRPLCPSCPLRALCPCPKKTK